MNVSFATRLTDANVGPSPLEGRGKQPATIWPALLYGALSAFAMPPFTFLPVLLFTVPGLMRTIGRARSARAAGLAGLAFGLGYNLVGLYWVTKAVLVMAAEFWWAVPITVPLLSAVLGLFIAVPCTLAWAMPAGWPRLAVLAGAWVLGDLARQFVLSGFPWNLLGSAWEMPGTLGLVFMQPAAWVGAHGLTLATLLLAACPIFGRRGWLTGAAATLLWAGAGAVLLARDPPPASPAGLTAVIAQGDVSEIEHRDHGAEPAWASRVFDRYLSLTRQGMAQAAGHPAIVIWPETASPYALAQDQAARLALMDAAAPALAALAGTVRFEGETVAHNSLVALSPHGDVAGIYDKHHLVPYGEYMPAYAHLLLGEQGFVPGPGLRTLHLPGLPPMGPLICYEAIFPGQVVQPGDRPAMLVNITNDAWFGESAGPRQHLAAARLRTVEEGLPMLRAANTGVSAVIDSHGRVLASLGLERQGVLVAAVPGALPPTLFSRFGLAVPLILASACLLSGITGAANRLTRVEKKRI